MEQCVKIFIMNRYISKELHNDQEYYWPITYRAGAAAVVSTFTSIGIVQSLRVMIWVVMSWLYFETLKDKRSIFKQLINFRSIPPKIVYLRKKVNLPQSRQVGSILIFKFDHVTSHMTKVKSSGPVVTCAL